MFLCRDCPVLLYCLVPTPFQFMMYKGNCTQNVVLVIITIYFLTSEITIENTYIKIEKREGGGGGDLVGAFVVVVNRKMRKSMM